MEDLDELFRECGLGRGRNFGSKSQYRNAHPQSVYIPNAWVGTPDGKFWGGDLDLNGADSSRLRQAAALLNRTLYVLRESAPDLRGEEVAWLAQAVVTADEVQLTQRGSLLVPEVLADGAVRITRSAQCEKGNHHPNGMGDR